MRCEQVKALLNDYSGGCAQPSDCTLAGGAPECLRRVAMSGSFVGGFGVRCAHMPAPSAPADLHARIMTHVRAHGACPRM
jgi:hypothetical protein